MVWILLNKQCLFTVFNGKDYKSEECTALSEFLTEKYPSAEVYFVDGGQEVYPYIFVAE